MSWLIDSPMVHVEGEDMKRDISCIIDHKLRTTHFRCRSIDDTVRNRIKDALNNEANAVILWVILQLETLAMMRVLSDVEACIKNLPKNIDKTYDALLELIRQEKGAAAHETVLSIFRWLIGGNIRAKRPLEEQELTSALSFNPDKPEQQVGSNDMDSSTVLELCHNMIILEKYKNINVFVFFHASAREYMVQRERTSEIASSLYVTRYCAIRYAYSNDLNASDRRYGESHYYNFKDFRYKREGTKKSGHRYGLNREPKILNYVNEFWFDHLRRHPEKEDPDYLAIGDVIHTSPRFRFYVRLAASSDYDIMTFNNQSATGIEYSGLGDLVDLAVFLIACSSDKQTAVGRLRAALGDADNTLELEGDLIRNLTQGMVAILSPNFVSKNIHKIRNHIPWTLHLMSKFLDFFPETAGEYFDDKRIGKIGCHSFLWVLCVLFRYFDDFSDIEDIAMLSEKKDALGEPTEFTRLVGEDRGEAYSSGEMYFDVLDKALKADPNQTGGTRRERILPAFFRSMPQQENDRPFTASAEVFIKKIFAAGFDIRSKNQHGQTIYDLAPTNVQRREFLRKATLELFPHGTTELQAEELGESVAKAFELPFSAEEKDKESRKLRRKEERKKR